MLIGTALRIYNFPAPYEQRDSDEVGYLQSSLAVLEGAIPGYKAAPAGPQIWIGWCYAAAKTAGYLLMPTAEERACPLTMRPFIALNHALFDCYRELGGIRMWTIGVSVLISIVAIWAAFRLGCIYAGSAGGILLGGLVACLPLFVNLATQSRPYSLAWSFGFISLYQAAKGASSRRWTISALFLGLSIASRIEMLCLAPFVIGEYIRVTQNGRWRLAAQIVGLALLIGCATAPWLTSSLVGNLKTIVAVRLIGTADTMPTARQSIAEVTIQQGLLVTAILLLAGFAAWTDAASRGRPWLVLLAMLLVATILRPTGYGLQHQGPAIMVLVVYAAIGLGWIERRWPRAAVPVALLAIVFPLAQSLRMIHANRVDYVASDPTAWIERNVPAGTTVYWWLALSRLPLPTIQASDAIWAPLSDPHAYERKMQWGSDRVGSTLAESPRVLADDLMAKDRTQFRCWFVLGGRSQVQIPRYDVRILGGSAVFGNQDPIEKLAGASGVIVVRGEPVPALGEPEVLWTHDGVNGIMIYCSPDVRAQLRAMMPKEKYFRNLRRKTESLWSI